MRSFIVSGSRSRARSFRSHGALAVEALVDLRDLRHPAAALAVVEVEHRPERPVEVEGDEGYLLVQRTEGVA
jgi:hypothetical protein